MTTVHRRCRDDEHAWACFDHYGCPTGQQVCEVPTCRVLRNHPDHTHVAAHLCAHRVYLNNGGMCWCQEGEGEDGDRDSLPSQSSPTHSA